MATTKSGAPSTCKTIPDIPILCKKRKRQFVWVFHFPGEVRRKERRQRWKRSCDGGDAFVCTEDSCVSTRINKNKPEIFSWYSFTTSVLPFSEGCPWATYTWTPYGWFSLEFKLKLFGYLLSTKVIISRTFHFLPQIHSFSHTIIFGVWYTFKYVRRLMRGAVDCSTRSFCIPKEA